VIEIHHFSELLSSLNSVIITESFHCCMNYSLPVQFIFVLVEILQDNIYRKTG